MNTEQIIREENANCGASSNSLLDSKEVNQASNVKYVLLTTKIMFLHLLQVHFEINEKSCVASPQCISFHFFTSLFILKLESVSNGQIWLRIL